MIAVCTISSLRKAKRILVVPLAQCHYLFFGELGYASHTCKAEPIFKHGLGDLQNAFFPSILNRIIVITQILHIRLIIPKFNFIKITNFRNLKYRFEELVVKSRRDFIQFVQVFEQIEPQVEGRSALLKCFLKPCEHSKSDVYVAVHFSAPFDIGKRDVPNNIATLIFWDRLVVEKTQRVNFGIVKFIIPALFDKDCNSLTYIKEQPAKKMVLLGNLHFCDEPVSAVVCAVQVKYGGSLFSGFVDLLVWEQHNIFNLRLQEFSEECLYKGDELGFIVFLGKDSFECEIDEKRSEASWLCKLVWGNNNFFWHKASFKSETKISFNKSPEKGGAENGNIENRFLEAA